MKRKKELFISVLLSLALLFGAAGVPSFAAASYSDTAGHWAQDSITRWSSYGIVEGQDGKFMPDAPMTRGQFAKVIAGMLGLTEEDSNPFSDVSADAWYAPYILRCYHAGIMLGSNGSARPNDTISRQEAMVMICRALSIPEGDTAALAGYSDASSVASWAAGYVAALLNAGIVKGISETKIGPKDNVTRAAVMTIFDRAVSGYYDAPGTYQMPMGSGIIIVASGDVVLFGATSSDILITPAADGKTVTLRNARAGTVTVQSAAVKVDTSSSAVTAVIKPEQSDASSGTASGTGTTGGRKSTLVSYSGPSSNAPEGDSTHNHTWDEGVVTAEADCTTTGVMSYTCFFCGLVWNETIPMKPHSFGRTISCTDELVCDVCGLVKPAGSHQWDAGEVTKKATCKSSGIIVYTCEVCGTTQQDSIPKLAHTWDSGVYNPGTGLTDYTCTVCGETKSE